MGTSYKNKIFQNYRKIVMKTIKRGCHIKIAPLSYHQRVNALYELRLDKDLIMMSMSLLSSS